MREHKEFKISSKYKPSGDQPKAIEQLVQGIHAGYDTQTLLGITGSGKTFTIANVIEKFRNRHLSLLIIKHLLHNYTTSLKNYFQIMP